MTHQKDGGRTDTESLRMEYRETVETLRNWDSLFFNAGFGVVVSGGIGGGIGLLARSESSLSLMATWFLVALPTALLAVVMAYIYFALFIAKRKFEVLREIEDELGLKGAYRPNLEKIRKRIWAFLLPLALALYVFSVVTGLHLGR